MVLFLGVYSSTAMAEYPVTIRKGPVKPLKIRLSAIKPIDIVLRGSVVTELYVARLSKISFEVKIPLC